MDLPYTKLPVPSRIQVTDEVITGEIDFSKVVNPFRTYARRWEFSPHLQFVKMNGDPESFRSFLEKWGVLEYGAYERSPLLMPTLISLSHPLHRKVELLKSSRFEIKMERLHQAQQQLRAVVMLWRAFRGREPDKMKSALSEWLSINKISFERFATTPIPLNVSPRALRQPVHQLDIDDLQRCVQASISRSFARTIVGSLAPQAPFLCLEPVYEEVPKSRVQAVVGNRMHYHVKDMLSAMWVMVFADVTRGLAEIDCANGCGTTFIPKRINHRYCTTECANAARARRSYWGRKPDSSN